MYKISLIIFSNWRNKHTFEKWLSPNLTNGTVGKALKELMTNEPFCIVYKLLFTSRRSEVFLTGRNRLRGTFIPTNILINMKLILKVN